LPYQQLRLQNQRYVVDRLALVDSGATVNVLPYSVGLQLGALWEQQGVELSLAGNLAAVPARGLLLSARIAHLPPVCLAFAWAYSDEVPLLLGQMNFFQEYEICFYQADWGNGLSGCPTHNPLLKSVDSPPQKGQPHVPPRSRTPDC
jgi:hypothetical protein